MDRIEIRNGAAAGFALALAVVGILALAPAADAAEQPLAIVDGDTISTADLREELAIMGKLKDFEGKVALPSPEAALHRMIQNRLIIQEGYRLGLDQDFAVRNQVKETLRLKMVAAMLDSIAGTTRTPAEPGSEAWRADRLATVDAYVERLMRQYDVKVDSTLLRSLDYGTTDPQVKKQLQQSDEVLAVLPSGNLRVRSLSMEIRFKEFHGLSGRPDAAEARDRIFREWLVESLLTWEGQKNGLDQKPELQRMARRLEENRVSEETLKAFLGAEFRPAPKEIEDYYNAHLDAVTATPRIKLESVLISDKEAAEKFRKRLKDGAKLSWLKKVTDEVVDGPAPFPSDWYSPEQLGVAPEEAFVGSVPEPYEVPGGAFAVAVVVAVEDPRPLPLSECRETILQLMRRDQVQSQMAENFRKLEAAADIRIMPDAYQIIERNLARIDYGE